MVLREDRRNWRGTVNHKIWFQLPLVHIFVLFTTSIYGKLNVTYIFYQQIPISILAERYFKKHVLLIIDQK